jgi:ADP-ribose pyrophosphatase YjhB (NUDIX family)
MARGGHGRQRGRGGRRGQEAPRDSGSADGSSHEGGSATNGIAGSGGTADGAGQRSQANRKAKSPQKASQKTSQKTTQKAGQKAGQKASSKGGGGQRGRGTRTRRARRSRWLRQVDEFSAGGLVLDLGGEVPRGALIARTDRHGRLLWSLPKGHIEDGETAEQAAVREVEEETGIAGVIVAELGTIDFWFVADGRRIHKTVQHYLMRATGGELSDADIEVTEVAWVPLPEIRAQLAYPDERGLVDAADRLLADTA